MRFARGFANLMTWAAVVATGNAVVSEMAWDMRLDPFGNLLPGASRDDPPGAWIPPGQSRSSVDGSEDPQRVIFNELLTIIRL